MLTNEGQRIRKGWQGFGIPSRLTNRKRLSLQQLLSKHRDEGKERQQSGSGAQDRQVRPLALGLHPQMGPHPTRGDFDAPAQNKPLDDLVCFCLLIRAQQGHGFVLASGIANEDPTDRDRRNGRLIPQSRARGDLHLSHGSPIPGQPVLLLNRLGVVQTLFQLWLPSSLNKQAHQQRQQQATEFSTRPCGAIEDTVIVLNCFSSEHPITRKMAVTVRDPGARIAPIRSTLAHSHTRSLKTASNWRKTCIILLGSVCISSFPLVRFVREAYSAFRLLSSEWIKSTSSTTLISLQRETNDQLIAFSFAYESPLIWRTRRTTNSMACSSERACPASRAACQCSLLTRERIFSRIAWMKGVVSVQGTKLMVSIRLSAAPWMVAEWRLAVPGSGSSRRPMAKQREFRAAVMYCLWSSRSEI